MIIIVALVVMAGLLFLVEKTKLGRAMRATAEQTQIAALMGVNPNRVISITFMLGGLLLGLIESLGAGYIGELTGGVFGSNYQDIFAFLVLILVLVLRPTGLLGEKVSDRA